MSYTLSVAAQDDMQYYTKDIWQQAFVRGAAFTRKQRIANRSKWLSIEFTVKAALLGNFYGCYNAVEQWNFVGIDWRNL